MLSQLAAGKNDAVGHIFRSLMPQGKVQSALAYISCKEKGGVLGLDDIIPESHGLTTRDVLKDKLPPSKQTCPESLLKHPSGCLESLLKHPPGKQACPESLLKHAPGKQVCPESLLKHPPETCPESLPDRQETVNPIITVT